MNTPIPQIILAIEGKTQADFFTKSGQGVQAAKPSESLKLQRAKLSMLKVEAFQNEKLRQ